MGTINRCEKPHPDYKEARCPVCEADEQKDADILTIVLWGILVIIIFWIFG